MVIAMYNLISCLIIFLIIGLIYCELKIRVLNLKNSLIGKYLNLYESSGDGIFLILCEFELEQIDKKFWWLNYV